MATSLLDQYLSHGWKIIPLAPNSKKPVRAFWNHLGQTLIDGETLPPNHGIGLGHAYSGTMALDIDHWENACGLLNQHNIDLKALYTAPDAVKIHSGRTGHAKLLYALALPLPSKKVLHKNPDGSTTAVLDFRCGTKDGYTVQDVLPPSVHPETGKPYTWEGDWTRLPPLPPGLHTYWRHLLKQDQERCIPCHTSLPTSWQEILEALNHVPPDIDRETWVCIGMALHWAGQQTDQVDEGFALWHNWSKGTPSQPARKYPGVETLQTTWRSFKSEGRTLGSLFHVARLHGWRPPTLTPEQLFAEIDPVVEELTDYVDSLKPTTPQPDLAHWPALLRERATEVAKSVGCDPLVPLMASLATIAGAADARIRLQLLPGFQVPPVLWLMIIGQPADKKSPGSRPIKKILQQLEKENRPSYKAELLKWEAEEALHANARKVYIEQCTSEETIDETLLAQVPVLRPMPVPKKLTVQDITSQKMIRHVRDRPQGVVCWLDEMHAWIRKITDKKSLEDRSAWVSAYESEPYEMERVGAGDIYCENLAVSIYGNLQPRVLRDHLEALTLDGLMQRFIPAILRSRFNTIGEPLPAVFTQEDRWDALIRQIHALPVRTYTLSEAAYDHFRQFQAWHLKRMREDSLIATSEDYQTAAGKLVGQVSRLCLIFHLVENPEAQRISGDLMTRTIALGKEFILPTLKYIYSQIGDDYSFDFWLMNHILAQADRPTITRRDIKRSAKKQLTHLTDWQRNEQIAHIMDDLVSLKWVVKIQETAHQVEWAINPKLKDRFRQQRREVLRIRQARLDENRRIAAKSGKSIKRRFVPGYREEFGEE